MDTLLSSAKRAKTSATSPTRISVVPMSARLRPTTYDTSGTVTHIGTNQIARYSDHNHHLSGPMGGIPLDAAHPDTSVRYQSIDIGNTIDGA